MPEKNETKTPLFSVLHKMCEDVWTLEKIPHLIDRLMDSNFSAL